MLKFAIQNLMSRRVRSLLAFAGLTVAIAGMVGLFSVRGGIDRMVTETFGQIPGLAVMQAGAPFPLFSRLPATWDEEIREVPGVSLVVPETLTRVNMLEGKRVLAPPRLLFGTDMVTRSQLRRDVYRESIEEGQYLNKSDRGKFNTVISRQIAKENHDKQVGDSLNVDGHLLKIVGIYDTHQLMLDVTILVDLETARQISGFGAKHVSCFYVEGQAGVADKKVADKKLAESILERFRGRPVTSVAVPFPEAALTTGHPLIDFLLILARWTGGRTPAAALPVVGEDSQPLEVRTSEDWSERFDEFSDDLDLFLTVMTGIGVLIAILSIINTMLMSVSERIIEFGILKANGWSRQNVLTLITCESAVLGFVGGVTGCLLGWFATQVINHYWPEHIQLFASAELLAFSFAFSVALGIFGGLYPALWAMRLMPMDAIRRG